MNDIKHETVQIADIEDIFDEEELDTEPSNHHHHGHRHSHRPPSRGGSRGYRRGFGMKPRDEIKRPSQSEIEDKFIRKRGETPYAFQRPLAPGFGKDGELVGHEREANEQPHRELREISCIMIADHVNNCPICTKFYKHDDTFLYIVLFILLVICLFLLKKTLKL